MTNDYGIARLEHSIANMQMYSSKKSAQAELAKGLQLRNGDLDALITQFETLVRHANYDVNQPLVMQIFTNTLPHAMYGYIINHVKPCNYEGWQEAAIQQQKTWVHMKSRLNRFAPKAAKPANQFSNWKPNNQWGRPNMGRQTDPNAMDTTPDQIRGRLADAEEILPGGNRHEEHVTVQKKGGREESSKGKSSPVITVERLDTLHEIVGNQNATITPQTQDHRVLGRGIPTKTTTMLLEA
jgi:hypothetical protein